MFIRRGCVRSNQITYICQITLHNFNDVKIMGAHHNSLFLLFVLVYEINPCHHTHTQAHVLTRWSLLLACLWWSLSLGWWFVTHSLCTLRLVPNLSLQTLPQTSILSPLWPFLFLPCLFLFCQSLGRDRDADALWQGTECVQDFMSVLFF